MGQPVRNPSSRVTGFTLVELLIVVVMLGILATIALPSATHDRAEAVKSALKANVQGVGMLLEYKRQQTTDGSFPATLEGAWFASGSLPGHPDQMAGVPQTETVNTSGATHPANKIITSGSTGAYWYNTSNGAFRARVKALDSNAETLDYYNQVNGSHAIALGSIVDSRPAAASSAPADDTGGGSTEPPPADTTAGGGTGGTTTRPPAVTRPH